METTPKKRGRPRAFDADEALLAATRTFLARGYAGASLTDLTEAMGLAKPSLYAAFGDKQHLYLRVLEAWTRAISERFQIAFAGGASLEAALRALFDEAAVYYTTDRDAPGCLVACTTVAEVVTDPEIGGFARRFFARCDAGIAAWILERKWADRAAADRIARLTNGVIRDIALRARVGEPVSRLRLVARDAATTLAAAARVKPAL